MIDYVESLGVPNGSQVELLASAITSMGTLNRLVVVPTVDCKVEVGYHDTRPGSQLFTGIETMFALGLERTVLDFLEGDLDGNGADTAFCVRITNIDGADDGDFYCTFYWTDD